MPRWEYEIHLVGKDHVSGTMKKASGAFGGLATKIGAAAAAYAAYRVASRAVSSAVRTLTGELEDSVRMLAEEELATIRLAQAMKTGGSYTEDAYQGFLKYAEGLERSTRFTADQVIAAEAMLATFKLQPDVLKEALRLTLDMATATGQDLVQASVLMGKAAVGVTGTLSRYGIIVDQTDLKARGFAAVVDEINKEFGGQAQRVALSYANTTEQVGKAWDFVVDVFGDAIVKSPVLRGALQTVSEALWEMGDALGRDERIASTLNETLQKEMLEALKTVALVLPHLEAGWRGLALTMHLAQGDFKGAGEEYVALMKMFTKVGRGLADEYSSGMDKIINKLEGNIGHQENLRFILNATKEDLPALITMLDTETAAIADMGFQSANSAAVIATLKNRIHELRAVFQEGPPTGAGEGEEIDYEERAIGMRDAILKQQEWEQSNLDEQTAALEEKAIARRDAILAAEQQTADETASIWERDFVGSVDRGMIALSDRLAEAMFDTKTQFKDIWKSMAKDAMSGFFSKIMGGVLNALIPGAGFLSFLGFEHGGRVPGMQHGGRVGGSRMWGPDSVMTFQSPGEVDIPPRQGDKYWPLLSEILHEARTGIQARMPAGGGGVTINVPISVQTLDAASFRESARFGMVRREIERAISKQYIGTS